MIIDPYRVSKLYGRDQRAGYDVVRWQHSGFHPDGVWFARFKIESDATAYAETLNKGMEGHD